LDSIVSIVTRLLLGSLGFGPWQGQEILSSPTCPNWLWSQPSLLFNRCQGSFLGFKWPGCEADHSPVFSSEGKLYLSAPSTQHYGMCRDSFYFFIPLPSSFHGNLNCLQQMLLTICPVRYGRP